MHRALILVLLMPALGGCRTHRYQGSEQAVETTIYEGQPAQTLPPLESRPPRQRPAAPPPTSQSTEQAQTQVSATPHPSATPRPVASASTAPQFPTAKAVPGKPGFVYSPYDGAMIDVTGFSSGSKAKDPATNKIFIVP